MISPVLTRVPSTRPETVGTVPLSLSMAPFFRRSAADFIRSSEPVSLIGIELELGFLCPGDDCKRGKKCGRSIRILGLLGNSGNGQIQDAILRFVTHLSKGQKGQ